MSNKEVLEVTNLNKDYEFLMALIGLKESKNLLGFTEYSEDKLDALDCLFYVHLDKEEHDKLTKHIEELKRGIDLAMDRMQSKINRML